MYPAISMKHFLKKKWYSRLRKRNRFSYRNRDQNLINCTALLKSRYRLGNLLKDAYSCDASWTRKLWARAGGGNTITNAMLCSRWWNGGSWSWRHALSVDPPQGSAWGFYSFLWWAMIAHHCLAKWWNGWAKGGKCPSLNSHIDKA